MRGWNWELALTIGLEDAVRSGDFCSVARFRMTLHVSGVGLGDVVIETVLAALKKTMRDIRRLITNGSSVITTYYVLWGIVTNTFNDKYI